MEIFLFRVEFKQLIYVIEYNSNKQKYYDV